MLKRILRPFAVGVCLGMILLAVQRGLHIDKDAFMRSYWMIAPAIVVGAVLVNVFYNISYQRKMKRLVPLLDSGKTEEYIAGTEALLQTAKGEALRNILKLNLAAGYMEMKRFDTAMPMLEELASKRLRGVVRAIHRLNLCLCCFRTGQYGRAMELYRESQEIFRPYRKNRACGGNIAEADILAAIREGQYAQAETLLDAARKTWSDPRLQEDFCRIGELLAEIKAEG